MIDWCLQKDPKKRPSCEELRNHPHFQPFLDPEVRNQYKERIKEQICDRIDDVGKRSKKLRGGGDRERIPSTEDACVDAAAINEKTQNVRNSASAVKRNPVEQNRPPGTSWVFPGMSDDSNDPRNENSDFFDEFERTTQGENFVQPTEDTKAEPKDDLNDFMDQLQEITSGENFKRT
jgi:serine/threonine protein kinase